jgi:hypothetical protein
VSALTKHISEWDSALNIGPVNHMTGIIQIDYKAACSVVFGDFREFSCC